MNIKSIGHAFGVSKLGVVSKNVSVPMIQSTPADSVSFGGIKKVPVKKRCRNYL